MVVFRYRCIVSYPRSFAANIHGGRALEAEKPFPDDHVFLRVSARTLPGYGRGRSLSGKGTDLYQDISGIIPMPRQCYVDDRSGKAVHKL